GEKPAGSPGDLATAEWIEDELASCGYKMQRTSIPIERFLPSRCELVGQDKAFELFPQPLVVATPPNGITARLALVYDKFDTHLSRDRIAVVVAPYARHAGLWTSSTGGLVSGCAEAGALACIILPSGPTGEIVALNTFADRPFAPIPLAIGRAAELHAYAHKAGTGEPV